MIWMETHRGRPAWVRSDGATVVLLADGAVQVTRADGLTWCEPLRDVLRVFGVAVTTAIPRLLGRIP